MDRVCSLLRGVDLLMEVTSKLVTIYLALLLLRAGSLRRNRLRQLALFDLKHSPVERISPGNEQALAKSVFLALLNPVEVAY